jgi:quercetin dioxygenase-like cupin family protein
MSLVVLTLVALLGMALLGRGAGTAAQDATPAEPEGVSFVPIAFGQAQDLMLPNADFVMFHLTIDPGATFTDPGNDPSTSLIYVETGTVTFQLAADVEVLRGQSMAAMMGTPVATPMAEGAPLFEQVPANTEFQLAAGDSVLIGPNVAGTARNDGDQPVSLLAASVGPPEGAATPAS